MLYCHISGTLSADPAERRAANGNAYVTALLRVPVEGDDSILASVIAFDAEACAVLRTLRRGDAATVAGRAKLSAWTGRDGEQRRGLSVVAQRALGGKPEPRKRPPRARRPASDDADAFPEEAGDLATLPAGR
jgi:single-stranded DNA-binding protein